MNTFCQVIDVVMIVRHAHCVTHRTRPRHFDCVCFLSVDTEVDVLLWYDGVMVGDNVSSETLPVEPQLTTTQAARPAFECCMRLVEMSQPILLTFKGGAISRTRYHGTGVWMDVACDVLPSVLTSARCLFVDKVVSLLPATRPRIFRQRFMTAGAVKLSLRCHLRWNRVALLCQCSRDPRRDRTILDALFRTRCVCSSRYIVRVRRCDSGPFK